MARKTPEDAARTREAIIDFALTVFAERGFAAAQLEDIAARAGVTRGAVYHHFSGKEELHRIVQESRWTLTMKPVLEPLRRRHGAAALRAFVIAFLRAVDTDPVLRALMKVSLAGDVPAALAAEGLVEKRRFWDHWLELIDGALRAAGRVANVRLGSEAILHQLVGYSVWSTLFGPPAVLRYSERAETILTGVLSTKRSSTPKRR